MSQAAPLSERDRKKLKKLVDRVGENEAIFRLQITRHTLARCLAGLSVQRGTAALVQTQLESEPS
jgi:hypothetical protein